MQLPAPEARRRFARARVLRLATTDPATDPHPHLVPAVFAVHGDTLVTAIDTKPKRHPHLRRLRDIAAHPAVSALVDHYDDADWTTLWWARADGTARVLPPRAPALGWLTAKYPQYLAAPPPGPIIAITVTRWSGWQAATPTAAPAATTD